MITRQTKPQITSNGILRTIQSAGKPLTASETLVACQANFHAEYSKFYRKWKEAKRNPAMQRIGEKLYLVSDNAVIPDNQEALKTTPEKLSKAFCAASLMPRLTHKDQEQEFNIMTSDVAEWLVNQPEIRQQIFTKFAMNGAIIFDKESRTWLGKNREENRKKTLREIFQNTQGSPLNS